MKDFRKEFKQEFKQALQEGRAYDFIANEGYRFSKEELIEIIKNYDYTLYQLAKQTYTLEETLKEYGSMVVDNLNDYDFFEENEEYDDIDIEELMEEVEEEDLEELKDALKSRFNETFKGNERLLAIQLDGFSHHIVYDFGDKTSQIQRVEFSNYVSKQEFLFNRPQISEELYNKLKTIFESIGHQTYQNNAKELIYVRPDER